MNISGIIGFCIFFGLLALAIMWGGHPAVFISPAAAIIVSGVFIGAGLMAFGLRTLLDGLLALRVLLVRVPDETLRPQQAHVLRGLIPSAYAAGVLGTIIGLVLMLATLDDPSVIGASIAVAVLTVLYSVLLAEGLLRPGAQHIEHRCSAYANANNSDEESSA